MVAAAHRTALLLLALAGYAVVTILFVFVERPGLGISNFYYLPIALVAFAGGPILGAFAGVLGVVLYSVALFFNSNLPDHFDVAQASIRLVMFVGIGALIGWFGTRNRGLVAELSRLEVRMMTRHGPLPPPRSL